MASNNNDYPILNDFVRILGQTVSPPFENWSNLSATIQQPLRTSSSSTITNLSRNTQINRNNKNKMNIDIVNEEKFYYIYAELPGIKRENIDIQFFNNKISILAEKVRPYESPELSEIKYGKIERTILLPICITKKESVQVNFNEGILKIKIDKSIEEENKFSIKIE